MPQCPHCSEENAAHARYCKKCGKEIASQAGPPFAEKFALKTSPDRQEPRKSQIRSRAMPPPPSTFGKKEIPPTQFTRRLDLRTGGEEKLCAHCQASLSPEDRFCRMCGKPFSQPAAEGTGPAGGSVAGRPGHETAVYRRDRSLVLLDVTEGEPSEVLHIGKAEITIGSGRADYCYADDPFMAEQHVQIRKSSKAERLLYTIADMQSEVGTFLRLNPSDEFVLHDRSEFLIGQQRFRFQQKENSEYLKGGVWELVHLDRTNAVIGGPYPVKIGVMGIGRDQSCDIPIPYDPMVSKKHAQIKYGEDGAFALQDMASSNGVFYRIEAEEPLKAGDEILIGQHRFKLQHADLFGPKTKTMVHPSVK